MTPPEKSPPASPLPAPAVLAVCTLGPGDLDTLRTAAALAGTDGRLTVMAVIERTAGWEELTRFISAPAVEERLEADARRMLTDLISSLSPRRPTECLVRVGKPFLEVVHQVQDGRHDVVVKTAEDLAGIHRYLFASSDQHLLRKCPCPVWLRRPGPPPDSIAAAVDVDDGPLNRRIIAAAALAARAAAPAGGPPPAVHLLHAWDAPGEGLVRSFAHASGEAGRYVAEVEAHHWKRLQDLADGAATWPEAAGVRLVPRLIRGPARVAVPTAIRDLGAALLVMGTVARTGVPGLIIGNTAEDVLNTVSVSVLAVKPPGYVSPVAPVPDAAAGA